MEVTWDFRSGRATLAFRSRARPARGTLSRTWPELRSACQRLCRHVDERPGRGATVSEQRPVEQWKRAVQRLRRQGASSRSRSISFLSQTVAQVRYTKIITDGHLRTPTTGRLPHRRQGSATGRGVNVVGHGFDGGGLDAALVERGKTKLRQLGGDDSHDECS